MLSLSDGVRSDALVVIVAEGGRGMPDSSFLSAWRESVGFDVGFVPSPTQSAIPVLNEIIEFTTVDLAVISAGVRLPKRWMTAMTSVVQSATDAGSVSCFSSEAGLLSAPDENSSVRSEPAGADWTEYSQFVEERALSLAPTIPHPSGRAWLFPRRSLNVVGAFREISPGNLLESVIDFGARVTEIGLRNVLADAVYVDVTRTARSAGGYTSAESHGGSSEQGRIGLMARDRYGAFCLVKDRSRLHPDRLSVAVDCTDLTHFTNGTAINSANIALALSARFDHVTAVVLSHAPQRALDLFKDFGVGVDLVDDVRVDTELRFDVIYRPTQCYRLEQLQWLRRIADRIVVNVLDLIAFHNPAYHPSFVAFEEYRGLQRLTFEVVDGITFLTDFVAQEVLREYPRISNVPHRTVGIGLDPPPELRRALSSPRGRIRSRRRQPVELGSQDVLVTGVGFRHKNRGFAIRLAAELCRLDWSGRLVLVGPYPDFGSSEIDDARLLLAAADLSGRVIRCGHLDEETFGRALQDAGVLVFPSLTEGFGLPPFEAALAGTPAATPDHGVFLEVVPESARILRGFDLPESARGVLELLSDARRSQRVVDDLVSAADQRSWSSVALEVASLIEDSLRRPRNPIRTIVAESTLISV